jgi:Tol biopolymer transport system component
MKIALLLILAAVVSVVMGCGGSHPHPHASGPEGIDVVAANAQSVLRGRRLVFSLGRNLDNADMWEVSRGRIVNLTRRIRSGPDPQQAEAPSLSPDGTSIAFFLQTAALGECTDCYPMPYFIRSDGSAAHRFGANLPFVGFSSFWAPSWDRGGRSVVIAAPKTGLRTNDPSIDPSFADDDTGLFRFEVPSGRATELTHPGQDRYDYAAPAVSPDGRSIAFLRSAAPEPTDYMSDGVRAFVYVMSADGHGTRRLPLPARGYSSLWWCRGNDSVCVDTLKYVAPSANSNTYRVSLRTGKIDLLRNWPEAAYVEFGALSRDASFAVSGRTSRGRAELLAGPLAADGTARLTPVVNIPHTDGRHFFGVSISR